MTNPKGKRRGTRNLFARAFSKKGLIPLGVYMKEYKVGDIVDIKVIQCGILSVVWDLSTYPDCGWGNDADM
jgi:ribosomal protein L21E